MTAQTALPEYTSGMRVLERFVVETAVSRDPLWDVYTAASSDAADEPVILRVLRRTEATSGPADALLRRAQRLTTLSHPGLVPVLAAGVHDGSLVIVSADQPGVPLRAVLVDAPSHRLVARDTARLIVEAAEALHYLHSQQPPVLHGALRHGKMVLVGDARRAMVSDWGLAQLVLTNALDPATPLAYRAPEHTRAGATVGPAADQFVLASIAYECLIGAKAFPSEQQALEAIAGSSRPWLASQRSDLPAEIDEVLHRAWSVEPSERFQDVMQFARALSSLLTSADETGRSAAFALASLPAPRPISESVHPRPVDQATPTLAVEVSALPGAPTAPPRRSRAWFAVLATLVVAGGGIAVAMTLRARGSLANARGVATASTRSAATIEPARPQPVAAVAPIVADVAIAPADAMAVAVAAPRAAPLPTTEAPAPSPTIEAPAPALAPRSGVASGPLRHDPSPDAIAQISAALQRQIDTCAAGQPSIHRHVFVGVAFNPTGEVNTIHVVGGAASDALRACVVEGARVMRSPPVTSPWSQSFHLLIP